MRFFINLWLMKPKLFRCTVAIIGFLFVFSLGPDTSNHYPWYQFPYQLHHYWSLKVLYFSSNPWVMGSRYSWFQNQSMNMSRAEVYTHKDRHTICFIIYLIRAYKMPLLIRRHNFSTLWTSLTIFGQKIL